MATKGGYQARDFTKGSTWSDPWTYLDPLNLGSFFDPSQIDVPSTTGGMSSTPNMYNGAARQGLDSIHYGAGNATAAKQAQLNQLLLLQANGGGVNPAQLQFQQSLDQTNAAQTGAIASQRGINPALQATMINQGAVGLRLKGAQDAAILRAQQILASQGLASNALANTRQGDISQQGADASTLNTVGGLKYGQDALSQQDALQRAQMNMQAQEYNAGAVQAANASRAQFAGTVIGALGGAGASAAFSGGGGGGGGTGFTPFPSNPQANQAATNLGVPTFSYQSKGGPIPNYKGGGRIPGQAKVAGDSRQNDTVPVMASPGEMMLPRSVMMSKDAPAEAAKFVAAHMGHPDAVKRSKEFVKGLRKADGGPIPGIDEEEANEGPQNEAAEGEEGPDHEEAQEAMDRQKMIRMMTDMSKRLGAIERSMKKMKVS